jgi:hypothetical protein
MLAKVTITRWDGKDNIINQAIDGVFLVNMNRANSLQTRATTKSSFYFVDNLWDRRESPKYVECDSTVTALRTAADHTWNSAFILLPVFPNNNSSSTAVAKYVHVDSIAYAWEDKSSEDAYGEGTRTWIKYYEGAFRSREILVDLGIDQLLEGADSGSTSTGA